MDEVQVPPLLKQNETHSDLYFTYGPRTKRVKIRGARLTHIIGDLNNDGTVNIIDIVTVGLNFDYSE